MNPTELGRRPGGGRVRPAAAPFRQTACARRSAWGSPSCARAPPACLSGTRTLRAGISLIELDGCYQFCTKAYLAVYVKRALELRKTPPLSKASLEVLAIVAYNQPVTRSFIEAVRGVDSSYIVTSLLDKGLIAEGGQLDAPGRRRCL